MSDIQIFDSTEFGQVRVNTDENGDLWFVASDICRALDITNSRSAVSRLDDDEKGVVLTDTLGGRQEVTTVNEPGMYALVLASRKPEAKHFKRWITHDVIPSIRSHGAYLTPQAIEDVLTDPDTLIRLATTLKEERAARVAAEHKVEQLEPVAAVGRALTIGEGDMSISTLAKYLTQAGFEIGQNRLFKLLAQQGYLMRRHGQYEPAQRYMQQGLFTLNRSSYTHADGRISQTTTVRVTPKGVAYFIGLYTA